MRLRETLVWVSAIIILASTAAYRHRGIRILRPLVAEILTVRLQREIAAASDTGEGILLIFRATECPKALQLFAAVRALAENAKMPLLGLVVETNEDLRYATTLLERERLLFPLRKVDKVDAAALLSKFGAHLTPTVIRLRSNGKHEVLRARSLISLNPSITNGNKPSLEHVSKSYPRSNGSR